MKIKISSISLVLLAVLMTMISGCQTRTAIQSADSKIAQQQERNLAEGDAQVPPPSIVNWNEKRMLKLIQEKRDQPNLQTWTYTKNMDGKYTFVCDSIGYGLPYDTRSNNPHHYEFVTTYSGVYWSGNSGGNGYMVDDQGKQLWGEHTVMPQPEPNGLFIPEGARGTWNLCKDPKTGKADVTYQEEDVAVFPYQLPEEMVEGYHGMHDPNKPLPVATAPVATVPTTQTTPPKKP